MSSSDKYPGVEALPGYHLIKLLGRGGFGEVWKCEAPGGLHKAVKFVRAGGEQFRQEVAAFERVRVIRHPYLLTLERVELVASELVTIMELADCQIRDRFRECLSEGLRGIPRAELLGYLSEAAEALDMLSERYGLQHLDVKPENLFLLAGHVKVGDYGLVRHNKPHADSSGDKHGFTPRYSAPEILSGNVHARSDQYSLALVYSELLTGRFPYSGQTSQQLMIQHLNSEPDLAGIPAADQPSLRRALSKNPAERFPSCLAFIQTLMANRDGTNATAIAEERNTDFEFGSVEESGKPDDVATLPNKPRLAMPEQTPAPQLVMQQRETPRPISRNKRDASGAAEKTPSPQAAAATPRVVPLDSLHGLPDHLIEKIHLTRADFVAAVIEAATTMAPPIYAKDAYPEDALVCGFLSTLPAALVPHKVIVVAESWGMSLDQPDPLRLVMRWENPPPKLTAAEARTAPPHVKNGFEVVIYLPEHPSAEFTVIGATFGPTTDEVKQYAHDQLPQVLGQIRGHLQNLDERRKHPRFPLSFPVLVYPRYSDGVVGTPIGGNCIDISFDGVRFATRVPVRTDQLFLEIKDVEAVAGLAIYVRTIRTSIGAQGQGFITVGRFRTET